MVAVQEYWGKKVHTSLINGGSAMEYNTTNRQHIHPDRYQQPQAEALSLKTKKVKKILFYKNFLVLITN